MATGAQILTNRLETKSFINRVNLCKSVSKKISTHLAHPAQTAQLFTIRYPHIRCNYAKQTQFSKNQNEPKPLL